MSHLTHILILYAEPAAVEMLNTYLQKIGHLPLATMGATAGGDKVWCLPMVGGTFANMDLDAFLQTVLVLPWDMPTRVRFMIEDEGDTDITYLGISTIGHYAPSIWCTRRHPRLGLPWRWRREPKHA